MSGMADVLNAMFGLRCLYRSDPERFNDSLRDRILDALDDAEPGHLSVTDGGRDYLGPLATIQSLAADVGVSDSAIRRSLHELQEAGLVRMWVGRRVDPKSPHRRIFITAVN